MPIITLHTSIQAPVEVVFNLSRSIDLHTTSTMQTGERAVSGRITGLIEEGETVTWEARHLGKLRKHTSLITTMQPPAFFEDKMVTGDFKFFRHQHHFHPQIDATLMIDILEFASPYGWLGKLVDAVFMKHYLTGFLKERNRVIKQYAESDKWETLFKL